MISTRLSLVGSVAVALACSAGARADGPALDFNRDIRPILSESCFTCHGPDSARRKGDLRLDTKDGLLGPKVGDGVVVPGKPDESELIARVVSKEKDEVMPPPDSGKTLTPRQAETLRRWVESGADWKGHWAYIKPTRPPVPEISGAKPIPNEIDRFLTAKRLEKGVTPAPEADRITLIRRLSFDLRGLPPTPAEVDTFLKDARPDAFEKLVDRMMASPHFGERMAIEWLDLVRYADTIGYHSDTHRDVYLYRDYVIRAFNQNKPFDRFTVEQLAGDLLPDATDETKVASGYNRMLMTTEEGGSQPKEYMAKYAADRVRNVSTVWMGATLGCAECHDHKYDPFTTKDFYSFAAFFADLKETPVGQQEKTPILKPDQKAKLAQIDARIAGLVKTLETATPELDKAQIAWEASALAEKKTAWKPVKPIELKSKGGSTLKTLEDGSVLASGTSPDTEVYTLKVELPASNVTGLRLDVLPDPSLPSNGPGRADNGNFVLNEFEARTKDGKLAFSGSSASHAQDNWAVAGAVDSKPESGWAILPQTGKPNHAVFELAKDLALDPKTPLTITIRHTYGTKHGLGRFKISATDAPRPVKADGQGGPPPAVVAILGIKPETRSEAQKRELASYYRSVAPGLETVRKSLSAAKIERDSIANQAPTTLVSTSTEPRMMRILPRGNWLDDSGPVVNPAIPGFLSSNAMSDRRLSRLDLARWLVGPENPLVARVFVNRLWKVAFGQGLVSSLDDFGSQGAWPNQPELLDWLAEDFRQSGWDIKASLRRMLLSEAYRQSSVPTDAQRKLDPTNAWLSRQNRFRLDAELVRDNALAVSGLLVDKVGGPSAKPYQPAGYWAMLNFPKREWQADHGEGLYRRGLYTYWCRTFLHPSLLAFDASTREECRVERPRSNTPIQALVLLNDPSYVEAARAFAERIVRDGGSDAKSRLTFAYRQALSREPRPKELSILAELQARHRKTYDNDPKAALALLGVGEHPAPKDLDPAELASWTSVARAILNLHETISRN